MVVCVTYPRWHGSDDAPDWWLDLGWSTRRCPRATIRLSSPAGDDPTCFEGHPAFEEMQTREEPFVHHTDREEIVAHWASMSFVAALPEGQRTDFLGQLDGMLARRAVEAVDIPYRANLWITRRRPAPAPRPDRAAAAS